LDCSAIAPWEAAISISASHDGQGQVPEAGAVGDPDDAVAVDLDENSTMIGDFYEAGGGLWGGDFRGKF
jgi:hypothetical protein